MKSRHRQLLGAPIPAREITPEAVYLRRRELGTERNGTGRSSRFARRGLIRGGATWAAGVALTTVARPVLGAADGLPAFKKRGWGAGETLTPFEDITSYNNFYEFGTGKDDPRKWAHTLRTRPWTVSFEGEIGKPQTMDIDTLLKLVPLEERIYRLRCVEAWSMVIPWIGLPLGPVIKRLEPTSRAKFVAFSTLLAPDQMPGQKDDVLAWPYVEGLRIDEAMHPLTILAVGLYGKVLPNQNGAPIRLVVPWKYGFKSIKSVVKLRFVEKQPPTSWNLSAPREYGFYSNVNPDVDHPRWSQARERRIGQFRKMTTLPFNGYGGEVASLYKGMDLRANF